MDPKLIPSPPKKSCFEPLWSSNSQYSLFFPPQPGAALGWAGMGEAPFGISAGVLWDGKGKNWGLKEILRPKKDYYFFLNWELKLFPFPHFFSVHPLTQTWNLSTWAWGCAEPRKPLEKKGSAQGKINLIGIFYRHLYLSGKHFPFFPTRLIKQTKEIWEYPAGARQKSPRVFSGRVVGIALFKIEDICKGINSRETLKSTLQQEIGWNHNYKSIYIFIYLDICIFI